MENDNFITQYLDAEKALESHNLFEIVKSSLLLCHTLTDCRLFDRYVALHSKIISYLNSLNKELSTQKIFTEDDLVKGFYMALSCNHLIPRIYVSFFFAKAIKDEYYLEDILEMICMVGKPLPASVLRFTILSFLQPDVKIYWKFVKKNFTEMLYLYDVLTKEYPTKKEQIIGWTITNLSYMTSNREDDDLIDFFLNEAKQYKDYQLTESVFKDVMSYIDPEKYKNHYAIIKDFLENTEPSSEKLKQIHQMIFKAIDLEEMFNFIESFFISIEMIMWVLFLVLFMG